MSGSSRVTAEKATLGNLARAERRKRRLRNWDGARLGQKLERIAHRLVRGNVTKLGGEVCGRDRRKDQKEHKIRALKLKK